jgi:hypothetical protein
MLEGIVPFGYNAIEVERGHPDPLVGQRAHAPEVGGTLVQPGQWITLPVEGGEIDFWSPAAVVVRAVMTTPSTTERTTSAPASLRHEPSGPSLAPTATAVVWLLLLTAIACVGSASSHQNGIFSVAHTRTGYCPGVVVVQRAATSVW